MAGRKHQPGCPCCAGGCPVTLTINAKCGSGSLASTLIQVLDSAGVTVVGSTTGTTLTLSVDGTLAYKVRLTKTGYHTKTYDIGPLGCVGPYTYDAETWLSSITVTFSATMEGPNNCPFPGSTVTTSGSLSCGGTTGSGGTLAVSCSTSSSTRLQTGTLTITPPAGSGATANSKSYSYDACTSTHSDGLILYPDASHIRTHCGVKYLPNVLDWSDDFGTATISNPGTGSAEFTSSDYSGYYDYTSSNALDGTTCPGPARALIPNQTASVRVFCTVIIYMSGGCAGLTRMQINRGIYTGSATQCDGTGFACQPRAFGSLTEFGTPPVSNSNPAVEPIVDCSLPVISNTAAVQDSYCVFPTVVQESAATVTVTGTF